MPACFIIGAGCFDGFRRSPGPDDLLMAADGGFRYCRQLGLQPDLLLGDFDSLGERPAFPHVLQAPVEKDDTDMLLAVKEGLRRGYRVFHLYGGTGGRLDHTLANLQTLLYLARRESRGYLYDGDFVYTALCGGSIRIEGKPGDLFSLFCGGRTVSGLCIRGGQYPLEDARLRADFPLGVSNHFREPVVEISLRAGQLLLGWQPAADSEL